MLSKKYRLNDRRDVARVYARGRSIRSGTLSLKLLPNKLDSNRLSVVVSKKVAKSAPSRNRIRRRVYEDFRVRWAEIRPGFDMLLSVFDESVAVEQASELRAKIDDLVKKAGLK